MTFCRYHVFSPGSVGLPSPSGTLCFHQSLPLLASLTFLLSEDIRVPSVTSLEIRKLVTLGSYSDKYSEDCSELPTDPVDSLRRAVCELQESSPCLCAAEITSLLAQIAVLWRPGPPSILPSQIMAATQSATSHQADASCSVIRIGKGVKMSHSHKK